MEASNPFSIDGLMKSSEPLKARGLGIRGLFRVAILVVVAIASIALVTISFTNVTSAERTRAEASMLSEANYLCLQLESLGKRADAFGRIADSTESDSQALRAKNPDEYDLLSDPIGDVLSGYTLAETGTVFISADDTVVSSDDARVPAGADIRALLGDEVHGAIGESLKSGGLQLIPYNGVFDEPGGEGAYGSRDEDAYLLAKQQSGYTVAIIEPTSMVFRDRNAIMARETVVSIVLFILVSLIVDRLLSLLVARRIDKTNEALQRITSGELETRVEAEGTREFRSLASGINVTVEALQGWIAEAEARMESELSAARAIQRSALPSTFPPFPDIPEFDLYATMDAAREVGGDFYDFFLLPDSGPGSGKLVFLIADVSGKGVPAALFMMKAKTLIRRELQSGFDLSRAIERANVELAEGNDACMFVTMWVGMLDYATGHVEYVNAGHNPPLLWQAEGGWRWLQERSGLPLGLMDVGVYNAYSFDCSAGDKVLIYTDGVTEAMNVDEELFGEERLEAVANTATDECPEALVKTVRGSVASFAQGAEQSDDITILSLEARLRA